MPSSLLYMLAAASLAAVGSAIVIPSSLDESFNAKRDSLQTPFNGLPACNTKDTDPTWAVGKSAYNDGEGKYIGSDCDNGAKKGGHCWTDYFLVGTTDAYGQWTEAIGNLDCPASGAGSCSQQVGTSAQKCTSFTWSVSETISAKFGFELAEVTTTISSTQGQTYQSCNTNTTASTCVWTDGGCHSIWSAQRVVTVHGYKRRSCNSPTADPNANVQNGPQRADGAYTRGLQDFQVPLAGVSAIECQGTCDPSYSPGAPPSTPNNGALMPWPQ